MIGPLVGVRVGIKVGIAPGIGASASGGSGGGTDPMAGVSRDATSAVYCPANNAEWTTTMTVAGLVGGNPSSLWLCQEAAGNLADSIGAVTLVAAGAPTYRNAQAGWTRLAMSITATTVQAFTFGAGTYDPSTTSVAWLVYVSTPNTPGGSRNVVTGSSNATSLRIDHLGTNKLSAVADGNTASSLGNYNLATVYPLLFVYDRTGSLCKMYTQTEVISVAFAAVVDGNKGFGAVFSNGDAGSKYLYSCVFAGAAAEQLSSTANARALLNTLSWAPTF